eukprot:gene23411-29629_t
MYVWIGLFCAAMLLTGLMSLDIVVAGKFETLLSWDLLNKLRVLFMQITAMILFVLLPVYLWCTYNYKNYVYSYAWVVSATYVSGRTATIILFVFWMLFLVVMFYLCERCLFRTEFRKHIANRAITTSNSHTVTGVALLTLTVVLNIVLVVALNAVYVYIDITYSSTINAMAQIGMALFKLGWNNYLLPQSLRRVFVKPLFDGDKSAVENRVIAERAEMSHVMTETLLNLFNNIIAPCIATMAINVNCFYNVAVPPLVVQTQYSVDLCELIDKSFITVFKATKKAVKVIRQKSNFRGGGGEEEEGGGGSDGVDFEQVAVLPPSEVVAEDVTQGTGEDEKDDEGEGKTNGAIAVEKEKGGIELTPLSIPSSASERWSSSEKSTSMRSSISGSRSPSGKMTRAKPLQFDKQRFAINFISNTAILMTFGVIFPALALIICYNVLRDFGELQSEIARFHEQRIGISSRRAAEDNESKLRHIEGKVRNVSHTISYLLWLLFPLASAFYAFFVFDMLGDVGGWRSAVGAAVVMFAAPLLFMLCYEVYRYFGETRGWSSLPGKKRSDHEAIEWGDAYQVDEDDKEDALGGGRKRRASSRQKSEFREATEDCWTQLISAFLK